VRGLSGVIAARVIAAREVSDTAHLAFASAPNLPLAIVLCKSLDNRHKSDHRFVRNR
jgi:hypothetical protein